MKMRRRLFGVLAAAALTMAGCATGGGKDTKSAEGPDLIAQPEALIQVRHRGCEGRQNGDRCGQYSVSIYIEGRIEIRGVSKGGETFEQRARLPSDQISVLISHMDRIGFLDTPDNCCNCPEVSPDPADGIYIIDYRPGGLEKKVIDNERCFKVPLAIRDLEQRIESMMRGLIAPQAASQEDVPQPRRASFGM